MYGIWSKGLSEFIGTFALVFAGCGSIMAAQRIPNSASGHVIPVVFGLVVAAMIYAVGHISGAHFNPAVTLGFAIVKRFPKKDIAVYWTAQFLGAFVALGTLYLLLPNGTLYGATLPSVSTVQAIAWEAILTFFLMFVIIAVATDSRAVGTMAGVAIGATVMLDAFIGGAITGASMNPARSLAPAVFQGQIGEVWIYFLGPVIGAVLASIVYERIRCESGKDAKGCC